MLQFRLKPHPEENSQSVACQILRHHDTLRIEFTATFQEPLRDLANCEAPGSFTDNLWQSTCCELFIAQPRSTNYVEWNFATDGRYALYYFDEIRKRADEDTQTRARTSLAPLAMQVEQLEHSFKMAIDLPLKSIHDFVGHPAWQFQPTAILATADGQLSYWAPAHPRPEPDFHRFDHVQNHDPYGW